MIGAQGLTRVVTQTPTYSHVPEQSYRQDPTISHLLWPGRDRDGTIHSIGLIHTHGMVMGACGKEDGTPHKNHRKSDETKMLHCLTCGIAVTAHAQATKIRCEPCRKAANRETNRKADARRRKRNQAAKKKPLLRGAARVTDQS